MRRRLVPTLAFAALLVLSACGVVFTGDEPLWYLPCDGADADCSCSGGSPYTMSPKVEVCSGAKAGGLCCASADYPSYGECACRAVRCTNDSAKCQCSVWDFNQGELTECLPLAGDTCCLAPGVTTCTCSLSACKAGETRVDDCTPQRFSCALLAADTQIGSTFEALDTAVETCSSGPVN